MIFYSHIWCNKRYSANGVKSVIVFELFQLVYIHNAFNLKHRQFVRIQIFLNPQKKNFHVCTYSYLPVHTYQTRIWIHSSTQDFSGNIGKKVCVVKRAKFACRIMAESAQKSFAKIKLRLTPRRVKEITWERGCHLEYSIHGKELGSILLSHRIKKFWSRFSVHIYDSEFIADAKISTLNSGFKKFRILMPNTCMYTLFFVRILFFRPGLN